MSAIPTWSFVLVAVRLGRRFLLVQERKHGEQWYLPAGRVELGETLLAAAHRETLEESGIGIVLEGVVRVEHTVVPDGARLRVIFLARPADDTAPRAIPNEHSLGARFVTLDELAALPLRGDEVESIFTHIADGGPIYPLSVLRTERQ